MGHFHELTSWWNQNHNLAIMLTISYFFSKSFMFTCEGSCWIKFRGLQWFGGCGFGFNSGSLILCSRPHIELVCTYLWYWKNMQYAVSYIWHLDCYTTHTSAQVCLAPVVQRRFCFVYCVTSTLSITVGVLFLSVRVHVRVTLTCREIYLYIHTCIS